MRKLASIQKITNIRDIGGADRIQAADILGWHVVIKKGEFKDGDTMVYCEPDSILPVDNPNFAFLEGKPIKTKKMRGALSQGIVFPMSVLPHSLYVIGDDVTNILGVTKYDPEPKNTNGKNFIDMPDWIPVTNQTRCQTLQEYLKKYKGTRCVATEKLDGTSCTFWLDEKRKFHVCGHYKEILDKNDKRYRAAHEQFEEYMQYFDLINIYFQGELIGRTIQGNKYGLEKGEYVIFIYDALQKVNGNMRFAPYDSLVNHCEFFQFGMVPQVFYDFALPDSVDELTEMARGKSAINPKVQREGIVVRAINDIDTDDCENFVLGRFSLKVINPDFLLKYKC